MSNCQVVWIDYQELEARPWGSQGLSSKERRARRLAKQRLGLQLHEDGAREHK